MGHTNSCLCVSLSMKLLSAAMQRSPQEVPDRLLLQSFRLPVLAQLYEVKRKGIYIVRWPAVVWALHHEWRGLDTLWRPVKRHSSPPWQTQASERHYGMCKNPTKGVCLSKWEHWTGLNWNILNCYVNSHGAKTSPSCSFWNVFINWYPLLNLKELNLWMLLFPYVKKEINRILLH